ncbi:hypothetical protein [Caldanaerobacter subterraneus]|uniref:Uncharacterized protein n=1 Tax=Caldanaerobacter subterraneus TaxID=911092 RepID=A0A7Y2PMW8_9THEO|nr:hypothetical protein [Caldanaerobacter subterraneus]NNG67553.1 hypothetical protein [Caldanaerobacter subterraneus]
MILGFGLALFFLFLSIITITDKNFLSDFFFVLAKLSLIAGLFLGIIVMGMDDAYVYRTEVAFEEPIYSLETYPTAHGDFILGIGSVDSEAQYYFYVKNKEGEYELKSIYSGLCSIVETDEQIPHVKKIIKTAEFKSFYYKLLGGINIRGFAPVEHYILYVPSNTIKKVYSANIYH